jgi:hypothetical protein
MSFIDFAEVKARRSIEQAAKLLGLHVTEERNQMRAACPVCGGGPLIHRRAFFFALLQRDIRQAVLIFQS